MTDEPNGREPRLANVTEDVPVNGREPALRRPVFKQKLSDEALHILMINMEEDIRRQLMIPADVWSRGVDHE